MILLLNDGEMTENGSEYHHNLSKDRLLQNKLLEVDDNTVLESLRDVYKTNCRISSARYGRDPVSHEITGWIPSHITLRKTDRQKEKVKEGSKDFIHWRDARSKANHVDKYDNFVFSHYRDSKKYILQYREQHSNLDPSILAAKKRAQANNYIPPQQNKNDNIVPVVPTTNKRSNNHSYNFQYTRRDSQKPAKCRDDSSPSDSSATDTNTCTVSELDSSRERTKNANPRTSRTEKSECSTISVTRVTVPTPMLHPQANGGVKHNGSRNSGTLTPTLKGEGQQSGPRTLDTLACIADDRQHLNNEPEPESEPESEHSDAVSIGRLSTTCLSADVSVKVKSKQERSCTYKVFPSDLMITKNQPIVPNSMMWNPAKSSLEFRKKRDNDRKANEAGMNSPFKLAKDHSSLRLNLTGQDNEYSHQIKTRPKEFIVSRINEFPPLVTQNRCLVHSNTTLTEINEVVDLPPAVFFHVHGISSKSTLEKAKSESENCSNTNLEALKKYDAKKVLMLHKHGRSAPPEANRIPSETNETDSSSLPPADVTQPRPMTDDTYAFLAGQHPHKPRGGPYFKFWNSGGHGRSGVSGSKRAKWCTDLNLKHLAELVLAEQDAENPELRNVSNALTSGPPIASGSPESPKALDVMTWREQLDALRQIKPRTKSKHKKKKLYFFKENGEFEVQENDDYFALENYADDIDPMNKEQVSQQRRIRHLVEQSKLNLASRFNSLSGTPHTIDGEFHSFSNGRMKSLVSPRTYMSTGSSADDFSGSSVSGESGFAEDSQKQLKDKRSMCAKYCPSLIWRLPKNRFSYTTLSHPRRSQTCIHGDRRL